MLGLGPVLPTPMGDDTPSTYRECARFAFYAAVVLCAISALPFAALAFLDLVALVRRVRPEMPWPELGATVAVVWGAYIVAGQGAAAAFFVLRGTRRWLIGWVVTGYAIAAIIYGTVGLAGAVFWDPVGKELLEEGTRAEAWASIPSVTAVLGCVGAIAGLVMWWRQR